MKKHISFGVVLIAMLLTACGGGNKSSQTPSKSSSSKVVTSTSKAPVKSISVSSISLGNENSKAYITVKGKQTNYTVDDFKWAWGLKAESGSFDDGKATPSADDFKPATFDSNNEFTVKYCLTDIQTIKAGILYRIYGGTPEAYTDIPFTSNMFGASDATRKYYLRKDQDNSLVFENIQPLTYDQASVVEITQDQLPTGITNPGAYLKFGAKNTKNLTIETINSWNEAGNIAGNFQRVIPSYQIHAHTASERFWKIEDNYVYFYLYVGFIEPGEGYMTHFDLVSGNENAGLQLSKTIWGETAYTIGEDTYRIYADISKSTEEEYWGTLGVFKEAKAAKLDFKRQYKRLRNQNLSPFIIFGTTN